MNKQLYCKETEHLEILNSDIPKVPENGVIIKISYCGICHTDAHIYSEKEHKVFLPRVLGHEISGTIYEIGKGCKIEGLAIGNRVVVYPFGGCRKCSRCKRDNQNCLHNHGSEVHGYGFWRDGGFQEYVAVDDSFSIVHIPADISRDLACLVTCGGITAYNAVESCKDSITEAIRINGEANFLVMGVGGLGLWAIDIAKAMYGSAINICAVDVFEHKLKDAMSVGADLTLCVSKDDKNEEISSQVIKKLNSQKVDASVDFVNSSNTLQQILQTLNPGSTAAMVGIYNSSFPAIDMVHFTTRSIRLQGVYAGRKSHITKLFNLILQGKVKGPKIEHVKLEDVKDILVRMKTGELHRGRAVVKFA